MTINIVSDVLFSMPAPTLDQKKIVALLQRFAQAKLPHYPIIFCFVTGQEFPAHCIEMTRLPRPARGGILDAMFEQIYLHEVRMNPALHDGAIIASRPSSSAPYKVTGWSYRLVSPLVPADLEPNRGSAYNSAIAMSLVEHVDLVALVLKTGVEAYASGHRLLIEL